MGPFDITNLTSVWTMLTEGDGFKVGDIVAFVKENIGTFVSVSSQFSVYDRMSDFWKGGIN